MSIFTGAGVALVTPMHADGSVNFDKMKELIEFQIANDTDALIICGTTGEASTMSDEVQIECIRFAKEAAAGRVPVIAGAGSNDTAHCIALAQGCEKAGADAVLWRGPCAGQRQLRSGYQPADGKFQRCADAGMGAGRRHRWQGNYRKSDL